jgi:hypothetical protein
MYSHLGTADYTVRRSHIRCDVTVDLRTNEREPMQRAPFVLSTHLSCLVYFSPTFLAAFFSYFIDQSIIRMYVCMLIVQTRSSRQATRDAARDASRR